MNISNGVSEINFNHVNNQGNVKKAFIWPKYNQEKIEPVQNVKSKVNREQLHYSKPAKSEQSRIIKEAYSSKEFNYTASGKLSGQNNQNTKPGLLFTALA